MFKFAVVCAIVVVNARSSYEALTSQQRVQIQSKLVAAGLECFREHSLSLSDIKMLRNKTLPDGIDAMCFVACLFKSTGIMDDKGMLNPTKAVERAKDIFNNDMEHLTKTQQIVSKCASVNEIKTSDGSKGCERAKLAFACLVENAAHFGFDIGF